jgi:hypothetical protein
LLTQDLQGCVDCAFGVASTSQAGPGLDLVDELLLVHGALLLDRFIGTLISTGRRGNGWSAGVRGWLEFVLKEFTVI